MNQIDIKMTTIKRINIHILSLEKLFSLEFSIQDSLIKFYLEFDIDCNLTQLRVLCVDTLLALYPRLGDHFGVGSFMDQNGCDIDHSIPIYEVYEDNFNLFTYLLDKKEKTEFKISQYVHLRQSFSGSEHNKNVRILKLLATRSKKRPLIKTDENSMSILPIVEQDSMDLPSTGAHSQVHLSQSCIQLADDIETSILMDMDLEQPPSKQLKSTNSLDDPAKNNNHFDLNNDITLETIEILDDRHCSARKPLNQPTNLPPIQESPSKDKTQTQFTPETSPSDGSNVADSHNREQSPQSSDGKLVEYKEPVSVDSKTHTSKDEKNIQFDSQLSNKSKPPKIAEDPNNLQQKQPTSNQKISSPSNHDDPKSVSSDEVSSAVLSAQTKDESPTTLDDKSESSDSESESDSGDSDALSSLQTDKLPVLDKNQSKIENNVIDAKSSSINKTQNDQLPASKISEPELKVATNHKAPQTKESSAESSDDSSSESESDSESILSKLVDHSKPIQSQSQDAPQSSTVTLNSDKQLKSNSQTTSSNADDNSDSSSSDDSSDESDDQVSLTEIAQSELTIKSKPVTSNNTETVAANQNDVKNTDSNLLSALPANSGQTSKNSSQENESSDSDSDSSSSDESESQPSLIEIAQPESKIDNQSLSTSQNVKLTNKQAQKSQDSPANQTNSKSDSTKQIKITPVKPGQTPKSSVQRKESSDSDSNSSDSDNSSSSESESESEDQPITQPMIKLNIPSTNAKNASASSRKPTISIIPQKETSQTHSESETDSGSSDTDSDSSSDSESSTNPLSSLPANNKVGSKTVQSAQKVISNGLANGTSTPNTKSIEPNKRLFFPKVEAPQVTLTQMAQLRNSHIRSRSKDSRLLSKGSLTDLKRLRTDDESSSSSEEDASSSDSSESDSESDDSSSEDEMPVQPTPKIAKVAKKSKKSNSKSDLFSLFKDL